ncbi:MAG: aspartate 1-decarboxylase [bacterium]|nr:aspartate 1-decarboxylase [bacterium]
MPTYYIEVLKSKLHQARVTDGSIEYPGSLGISRELMDAVGLTVYEKILVANVENGQRFETYVIELAQPGRIVLNGAAAHLGKQGDRLIIMGFAEIDSAEAHEHKPRVAVLGKQNEILRLTNNPV